MINWLNMLRANYNFSLRDRIEAHIQARSPILGNYSRLDNDAAWGELKLKIKSVADKLGLHFVEVDPKNSSRQCRKCGYIDKKNRNKERFFCLSCNHLEDSDIQAAKLLLNRGLKQLGISQSQLSVVRRKVTTTEKSLTLVDEPSNPKKNEQLLLFDFDLWSANLASAVRF